MAALIVDKEYDANNMLDAAISLNAQVVMPPRSYDKDYIKSAT